MVKKGIEYVGFAGCELISQFPLKRDRPLPSPSPNLPTTSDISQHNNTIVKTPSSDRGYSEMQIEIIEQHIREKIYLRLVE